MKIALLALIATLCFHTTSFAADMNGTWSGDTTYTNPDGDESISTNAFDVVICGNHFVFLAGPLFWTPQKMTINGTDVIYDNQVVGTFTGTTLETNIFTLPGYGADYQFKMTLNSDDTLSFADKTYYNNQTTDMVNGTFQRAKLSTPITKSTKGKDSNSCKK